MLMVQLEIMPLVILEVHMGWSQLYLKLKEAITIWMVDSPMFPFLLNCYREPVIVSQPLFTASCWGIGIRLTSSVSKS